MPDSFPPQTWGLPPFDERDLDALLSGYMTDTPLALRQVADALAALRAAPAQAELSGEAAARAQFRALTKRTVPRQDSAAHAGEAHTLILPAPPADRVRGRAARHRGGRGGRPARPRGGRPPARRLGRRGGIWMGAGVLGLIVTVIAVTASLSGSIQRLAHPSAATAVSSRNPTPSGSGSQNVQAKSAATEPARTPAPSDSSQPASTAAPGSRQQSGPRALCREYYGYYLHLPGSPGKWSAERLSWFRRLVTLAGSELRVADYCSRYVADMFPHGIPQDGGQLGALTGPGTGSQDNGQQSQGNTGSGQPSPSGSSS